MPKHSKKIATALLVIAVYWLMAVASSRYPMHKHTATPVEWKGENLYLTNADTFDYTNASITLVCKKGKRFRLPERLEIPQGKTQMIPLANFTDYPVKRMNRRRFRPDELSIMPSHLPSRRYYYGVAYIIQKIEDTTSQKSKAP